MFFVGLAGFNFPIVMPLMAKYTFHVSQARLSVPMACSAIGSLLGGAIVAGIKKPTIRMLGLGAAIFGVVLAAYGGAPTYALWVAVVIPIGLITALYTATVTQLLQQSSRPEMLGRVMALYGIAFLDTTPIGAVLVAVLASNFTARAPFLAGGAVVMPIIVHVVSASLFCLFGALQFVPNFAASPPPLALRCSCSASTESCVRNASAPTRSTASISSSLPVRGESSNRYSPYATCSTPHRWAILRTNAG